MKSKNMIRTVGTVLTALSLSACSRCTVVPANGNLDPIPSSVSNNTNATVQKDALSDKQWNLAKIGIGLEGPREAGSARVRVAILGTGVDYNHEDLRQNIIVNQKELEKRNSQGFPVNGLDEDGNGLKDDFVGWDVVDWDGLPYDMVGDETAVAGIIGAVSDNGKGVAGINPNVSMIPVRYIDSDGATNIWNLFDALNYTTRIAQPDVIYLHLPAIDFTNYDRYKKYAQANDDQELLAKVAFVEQQERNIAKQLLSAIAQKNIPLVINAGALGTDVRHANELRTLVMSYDNVITVTSVDSEDKRPFIANYGPSHILTAAPGVDILSTLPGDKYGTKTGTYMAAAHVAGAIALGVSKYFNKVSVPEIKSALASAQGGDDIVSDRDRFDTIGRNRLNVSKYLTTLGTYAK